MITWKASLRLCILILSLSLLSSLLIFLSRAFSTGFLLVLDTEECVVPEDVEDPPERDLALLLEYGTYVMSSLIWVWKKKKHNSGLMFDWLCIPGSNSRPCLCLRLVDLQCGKVLSKILFRSVCFSHTCQIWLRQNYYYYYFFSQKLGLIRYE